MKVLQIKLLLFLFFFSGLIYAQDASPKDSNGQDTYVSFTLKNNHWRKSHNIFTPYGTIKIYPQASYPLSFKEGADVMYGKKKKRKRLLTVTAEIEGKIIDIENTVKKGKVVEIVPKESLFPLLSDIEQQQYEAYTDSLIMAGAEMPRFPGCEDMDIAPEERRSCAEMKLLEFIYKSIKYPTIARENGIEGVPIISFVIEEDGSVSNAEIIQDLGGGCGKEALRIINAMPKWIPGKIDGEPVRVQFNLPIKFGLEG